MTGEDAPIGTDERDTLLAPLLDCPVLVLAVSGGPDSTALLHLVAGWWLDRKRDMASVLAVTVDHGLRAGSAQEAADVARQAGILGVPHRISRWEGPAPASGLQAAARAARYRLLALAALDASAATGPPATILTAHTADDQAETFLMRLARGSGVDGLSAIPARTAITLPLASGEHASIPVLRPFLSVGRGRLLATLAVAGIPYSDDPSNRDTRFERVRVREALEVLARLGVTREALARSAARLRLARSALEQAANDVEAKAVRHVWGVVHEIDRSALCSVPFETAVRIVRRVLAHAGGSARPAELGAVEEAVTRLRTDSTVSAFTIGGCIVDARPARDAETRFLRIYREPDRDGGLPRMSVAPGQAAIWDARFRVSVGAWHGTAVDVGPLGSDWSRLITEFPDLSRLALPSAAARGIPAFREAGRLLAVPWLAWMAGSVGAADATAALSGPLRDARAAVSDGPAFSATPLAGPPCTAN
ncbi:MAG: tRNA lysidine(34) synthetase TilS [Hyphomicrobiaceae bacterium]